MDVYATGAVRTSFNSNRVAAGRCLSPAGVLQSVGRISCDDADQA